MIAGQYKYDAYLPIVLFVAGAGKQTNTMAVLHSPVPRAYLRYGYASCKAFADSCIDAAIQRGGSHRLLLDCHSRPSTSSTEILYQEYSTPC